MASSAEWTVGGQRRRLRSGQWTAERAQGLRSSGNCGRLRLQTSLASKLFLHSHAADDWRNIKAKKKGRKTRTRTLARGACGNSELSGLAPAIRSRMQKFSQLFLSLFSPARFSCSLFDGQPFAVRCESSLPFVAYIYFAGPG